MRFGIAENHGTARGAAWGAAILFAFAAAGIGLGPAVPAAEAGSLPPAIAVYTEQVPTAAGGEEPATEPKPQRPAPVTPAVQHAIVRSGGSDAPALERVVSSASLGAAATLPPARRQAPDEMQGLSHVVVSAIGSSGSDRDGIVALLAIVLAPVALGGMALRELARRHRGA